MRDDVLQYASAIEAHSEHPIAKAIAKENKKYLTVQDFRSLPGRGAQGKVEGRLVQVVSPGYLRENNIPVENKDALRLMDEGKTVVFVLIDDKMAGAIAVDDLVREEACEAVRKLKEMGIEPIMLTGDARQVAERVSRELGIATFFAEVLPHQKVDKVKEVQAQGKIVAMVGDGMNDAPALAQANVGIAIGAGTDVAIETADIVLVKSDPCDVVSVLFLARQTYRKMIQNLWWASGYNIVALPLAAGALASYGILLSPAAGAVLMSASTLVVAFNAIMLKRATL